MPRFDRQDLCEALRRLPEEDLELALRTKIVPLVSLPGVKLYAACGPAALDLAHVRQLNVMAYAESGDLIAAARAVHGTALLGEATRGLIRRQPEASASRRMTQAQVNCTLVLAGAAVTASLLLPFQTVWSLASILSGMFFLGVVALRVLCLMPALPRRIIRPPQLPDRVLPVYSVLVPLFRETSVLRQLLDALAQLDYPSQCLDIKLILEEEDILMQKALAGIRLPPHFDVIVVPAGKPQTKPRALNYALQFCRGELLTIYDAEDQPEPDQLRKAAEYFAAASPDLACIQAQLAFYNINENWLTRNFTIEYAVLFGVLLPVLANHRLPLLLGGTSNHFRTRALRQVGAWDAYNVTEDADLGLRLARNGYDAATLDSVTYEEANTRLLNWMKQRARWLKGFLATWLVHMRSPRRFYREVGPAGFWVAQAMTLGVFASALLHPLCLVATVVIYAAYPVMPSGAGLFQVMIAGLNLFIFAAGYAVTIIASKRALRLRGIRGWAGTLATMPVYWLLISCAAWYALWQFAVAPFHWNKTEHGLSRQRPRRRRVARRKVAS
ncbi:glycosyltransferase family 2 protein [Aestuariivirga sp.]|uniref:glycosyltransferase family 2 protein n=1 Tax=Aestuariivirga sp. TaxID=2650926 RepID=UPI0035933685